jgi:hypothetical protein
VLPPLDARIAETAEMLKKATKKVEAAEASGDAEALVFWRGQATALAAALAKAMVGGGSAVVKIPHGLSAEVVERLRRPLEQWQAGEVFDISTLAKTLGDPWTNKTLFLRAKGLEVLRQWEGAKPYMYVYGSPGIGKSALLQLALLRALFQGDPVLFHVRGANKLFDECRRRDVECRE